MAHFIVTAAIVTFCQVTSSIAADHQFLLVSATLAIYLIHFIIIMTTAEVQSTPFNSCESVSVFINNIVSSSFASVELWHQWQCHICHSASDNYYYNR